MQSAERWANRALVALLSLFAGGCDYWHRVEVHNALDESVVVRVEAAEVDALQPVACDAPSSRDGWTNAFSVEVPPGESTCITGTNRGWKYDWSEVRGMALAIERGDEVCASFDGPGLDRSSQEARRLDIDGALCPHP